MFLEGNKVPRTLFEAQKLAGSATYEETVLSFKVSFFNHESLFIFFFLIAGYGPHQPIHCRWLLPCRQEHGVVAGGCLLADDETALIKMKENSPHLDLPILPIGGTLWQLISFYCYVLCAYIKHNMTQHVIKEAPYLTLGFIKVIRCVNPLLIICSET